MNKFAIIILILSCFNELSSAQCTITLSSPQISAQQALCDTTPILNIIYNITGSPGYTVTGLPAGVIYSQSNNVLTISGKPRQFGRFDYKVALTSCTKDSAKGTIVVGHTPTVNQRTDTTVCSGAAIPAIAFRDSLNTNNIVFRWTNNTPSIGLASGGIDDIASFKAVNTTATPLTGTITVTPVTLAGYAYIPNSSSNDVSVVDLANNRVVSTIPVQKAPWTVTVSPDGTRVYVPNASSKSVSVINTLTNRVVDSVKVGVQPWCAIVSPDGSRLYVATDIPAAVFVINTGTNKVTDTIRVGAAGSHPFGLMISPNGKRLYVTKSDVDSVAVINTDSNKVIAGIFVGLASRIQSTAPEGIAITPDGRRLYVGNENLNYVSVIDANTNTETKRIYLNDFGPTGVTMHPDGTRLYVACYASNDVTIINTVTDSILTTVKVGPYPVGTSLNADGSRLYVVCKDSNKLYVVNTVTNKLVDSVKVGKDPFSFGNFILNTGSCYGASKTFSITVNPTPDVTATPIAQIQCSRIADSIILSGRVAGTVFNWTNDQSAVLSGIAASGTGSISGTLTNRTNALVIDTFTITPSFGVCPGTPVKATIGVKPLPVINKVNDVTYCNRDAVSGFNFSSPTPDSSFTWTASPSIGFGTRGAGFISPFIATNPESHPDSATVVIRIMADKCPGDSGTFKIRVNPSPSRPDFQSLSQYFNADTLRLCQESYYINFDVGTASEPHYHWLSDAQHVRINDANVPNTVISFPDAGTYVVTLLDSNSYGCVNAAQQTVVVHSGKGINRAGIFLKQPGNLLIYPDNSLDAGDGYQWGYDSLMQAAPIRLYSAPVSVAGQVYPYFIPDKRFLDAGNHLDTAQRAFWVLLKKETCTDRVYYNGPYAARRSAAPIPEDKAIVLAAVPNPNNGRFALSLKGDIYGDVHATVYNAVGQPVFNANFTKTAPIVSTPFSTGFLPDGLYYIEVRSSDLRQARACFVVRH